MPFSVSCEMLRGVHTERSERAQHDNDPVTLSEAKGIASREKVQLTFRIIAMPHGGYPEHWSFFTD